MPFCHLFYLLNSIPGWFGQQSPQCPVAGSAPAKVTCTLQAQGCAVTLTLLASHLPSSIPWGEVLLAPPPPEHAACNVPGLYLHFPSLLRDVSPDLGRGKEHSGNPLRAHLVWDAGNSQVCWDTGVTLYFAFIFFSVFWCLALLSKQDTLNLGRKCSPPFPLAGPNGQRTWHSKKKPQTFLWWTVPHTQCAFILIPTSMAWMICGDSQWEWKFRGVRGWKCPQGRLVNGMCSGKGTCVWDGVEGGRTVTGENEGKQSPPARTWCRLLSWEAKFRKAWHPLEYWDQNTFS